METTDKSFIVLFRKAELKRKSRTIRCLKNGNHFYSPLTKTAALTGTMKWICIGCGNITQSA
jgi:hypothetical protein